MTMALAELAEQLHIDQLEIIERNRVHEGQELKILGAIGEGKRQPPFPSAASCALEAILRQGRKMIDWSSPKPQERVTGVPVVGSPLLSRNQGPGHRIADCRIKLDSEGTLSSTPAARYWHRAGTVVTKLTAEVLH